MTALPLPADEPQLDLAFGRHPHAGTRFLRRRVRYPYVVTGSFRLDDERPDLLSVILQSASGAILGEDRLSQRIAVAAGAAVHLTTQAAMAVHRMAADRIATEDVALVVEAGGYLEYLPAPRILFPESALAQRLDIVADAGAAVMVADGFVAHDPEAAGRHFRAYEGEILVRRPDGRPIAHERFRLDGPPNRYGKAAALVAHGTLIVVPPAGSDLDGLGGRIEAALPAEVYAAVSALPHEGGIGLRLSAADGRGLRHAIDAAWSAARLALTGRAPTRRRY